MKWFKLDHNSAEWYAARAGVATSSAFEKIITKSGAQSSQMGSYANHLLAELVLGKPIERGFSTYSMDWGHMYEKDAIDLYKFDTGLDVEPGGFFCNDAMTIGASPDVRIFDGGTMVGLAEIKCPENPANHIEFLLMGKMNPKYMPQVQGQMLVSGVPWVDWFSYYEGMPPARIRVHRDEVFIRKLKQALEVFEQILDDKKHQLVRLGHLDEVPVKYIHGDTV